MSHCLFFFYMQYIFSSGSPPANWQRQPPADDRGGWVGLPELPATSSTRKKISKTGLSKGFIICSQVSVFAFSFHFQAWKTAFFKHRPENK